MLSPFSRIFNSKSAVILNSSNSPPGNSIVQTINPQDFYSPAQLLKVDEMRLRIETPKMASGFSMDSLTTGSPEMLTTTDLQDLSTSSPANQSNSATDVLAAAAAAASVSADEAANVLVSEKDADVRQQLESSGYLSVPSGPGNEGDSNSQDASQQSFLSSYVHDNTGAGNPEVNLFNNTAQLGPYPYLYDGNSYAQLTNSPNSLVNAQSLGSATLGTGHQFVSYNGETLLIQTSPNGTHQLVATLNGGGGRSGSPTQGLVQLERPFGHHSPNENDSSSPTDNSGTQIANNMQSYLTRVSPSTIQWLIQNYETAEGVSLPRSTLYNHYQRHCSETKQEPVNAASFGKLIRSVFIGLRTRRIGTRGNSKYHYYGIRVKPTSVLNQLQDEEEILNGTVVSASTTQPQATTFAINYGTKQAPQVVAKKRPATGQIQTISNPTTKGPNGIINDNSLSNSAISTSNTTSTEAQQSAVVQQPSLGAQMKNYLGKCDPNDIPKFPNLDLSMPEVPEDCDPNSGPWFEENYKQHCLEVVKAISDLNFASIEHVWKKFWSNESLMYVKEENNHGDNYVGHNKENQHVSTSDSDEESLKKHVKPGKKSEVSMDQIMLLWSLPVVQNFILEADYALYQYLIEILLPCVLKPIPNSLTQGIRSFSKNLENWMSAALLNVPEEIKTLKVNAIKSLAQTLRRYTGLNHLAQAARAVLQNSTQVSQMLADLNKVDISHVQEQASWVCQCDISLVQKLETEFKTILGAPADLETWATWLKSVVNKALDSVKDKATFPKAARQFLLKWSFYSSMIIRDLTLRSAASFGSFHLIRLLYDEYMFYIVEQRVAEKLGQSPVAIMGLGQFKTPDSMCDDEQPSSAKSIKLNGFGTAMDETHD